MRKSVFILLGLFILLSTHSSAQIIDVGSGSYTTVFPGNDEAGRNDFPSGSPQLSGSALNRPVPTNDWWSKLIKEDHADNLFNYPMSMRTINEGLVVSNIVPVSTPNGASQPIGDSKPIVVGVSGLNASRVTVADHSDWTVTMNWNQGGHDFSATSGIGMPFLYYSKGSTDMAEVQVFDGNVVIKNEKLIINNSAGVAYGVYAPVGSSWSKLGNVYTSTLNGENYWSMVRLPDNVMNVEDGVEAYQKFAYVFPVNTTSSWDYDQSTSILTTHFEVTTDVKEGTNTDVIQGLLPHQWAHLSSNSNQPNDLSYATIRGEMKVLEGNSFVTVNTFKGILPTLPYLDNYSEGFDPSKLNAKVAQLENDGLATWTDSYNEGQVMNRLIQTARVADEMGNIEARDKMVQTIQERLEDWLKAESGEVAFIYYYNSTWSTMIGYPAGHGQDGNLNDHHFHWGYFIHAASFVEQFVPGWADEWGGMIDLLIRDAASTDRADEEFPFLRNFSPYAGHSWANGFATFPFGNDQESTSESMQFASSLIHWGSITENNSIRDLGIYIYTTEQTASEEYWFDVHNRTFKDGYGFKLASRIWGNGYDNQTFWTSDVAAAYGIEMYPIHGGSLYLGHHQAYAQSLWDEISSNTGILNNEENPNLWHDTYWKYLSFIDPKAAIELYDSNSDRDLKFGISDAQTYHWLHAMNVLGIVNTHITADHPIAASFTNAGEIIYVAHNYGDEPISVLFSDGFVLPVPANELVTSRDVPIEGVLTSDFDFAYPNGSVTLTASVTGGQASKVEFYDGNVLLGYDVTAPFNWKAVGLSLGIHGMYAKVYDGDNFNTTNIVNIQVGEQRSFGEVFQIPGTIESAHFDIYEGGVGQGVSYLDNSQSNFGNYRLDEYVDSDLNTQEGPTLGWIDAGEWVEYSIDVETSGFYNVTFRYASANASGGGPFHFEIDGEIVSPSIGMSSTNGWNTWTDKVLENVELREGHHILRLVITNGEFNIGRMHFEYAAPLDYVAPVADAGENISVVVPDYSAILDGSDSYHLAGNQIAYQWEQIYGASAVIFDDASSSKPLVSNLDIGVYKFRLTVTDGFHSDYDDVLVILSNDGNLSPTISITSPISNDSFKEGENITITTSSNDIDGTVDRVEFYANFEKIGEATTMPFNLDWTPTDAGEYILVALAIDDMGAQSVSLEVKINVDEVRSCEESSNVAQQGAFSTGYEARFETVGSNVIMTFTLLDTDKIGVVAYLWQQSPFTEYEMSNVSGLTFSKSFGGQTEGTQLTFACKFAFAGGLAVTKYITYTVGDDCSTTSTGELEFADVRIFPNPTNDILYVEGFENEVNAVVYSVLGELVKTDRVINNVNVSDLVDGVYFIRFYDGDTNATLKFIKN